ncbi:MAG TPA: hypothetical protein VF334_06635 [Polyangia bacterium]
MALGQVQHLSTARGRPREGAQGIGERPFGGFELPQFRDTPRDNLSRALVFPFFVQAALHHRRVRAPCQRKIMVDFVTDRI